MNVKLSAHVAHSTSGIAAHTGYCNYISHIAMSSLNNFRSTHLCAGTLWSVSILLPSLYDVKSICCRLDALYKGCKRFYIASVTCNRIYSKLHCNLLSVRYLLLFGSFHHSNYTPPLRHTYTHVTDSEHWQLASLRYFACIRQTRTALWRRQMRLTIFL